MLTGPSDEVGPSSRWHCAELASPATAAAARRCRRMAAMPGPPSRCRPSEPKYRSLGCVSINEICWFVGFFVGFQKLVCRWLQGRTSTRSLWRSRRSAVTCEHPIGHWVTRPSQNSSERSLARQTTLLSSRGSLPRSRAAWLAAAWPAAQARPSFHRRTRSRPRH